MKKVSVGILFFMILFLFSACAKKAEPMKIENQETQEDESVIDESKEDSEKANTVADEVLLAPDKETVLKMRQKVLSGMTEEEITRLTEDIKYVNLQLEQADLYDNFFQRLSNPDDLSWNYIEDTGEIQIGWAYEDEDWMKKKDSNLTEDEFNEKYGQRVTTYNKYDADDFITIMIELEKSIEDVNLEKDINELISNMEQAKETHDVKYMEQIYKTVHDMDYFLLRYGPEDVGKYTMDASTVCKYYGVLNVYRDNK